MKPEELKERLIKVHSILINKCWNYLSPEDLVALKELDDLIDQAVELEDQLKKAIVKMEEMASKHETIATNTTDKTQKQIHLSSGDSARFCVKMLRDEIKPTKKRWHDKIDK
ncbi:MAG: hypothetical protein E7280_08650 [Lachnospiraceae bacterium]|nr:hypothetical protein [Lachnospiraceae bacterium]